MNLQVNPTSFQLQILCFVGGNWALPGQTRPLPRMTRNGRQQAVEKQEAHILQFGSGEEKELGWGVADTGQRVAKKTGAVVV